MEEKSKKRILLLVTNTFAAMNVIHSGLIKEIAHTYQVYILSDYLRAPEIEAINRQMGIDVHYIPYQFPTEPSLIRLLRRTEKALFFSHFQIITQKIKELDEAGWTKYLRKSILTLFRILSVDLFTLKQLRKIIIELSRNESVTAYFNDYGFDGVISSSPFDIRENQLVNSLGKPALAIIISWDNLTTKGLMNADHDDVLVWNKLMAAEYEKYHKAISDNPGQIRITGIARFDVYFKADINSANESDLKVKYGMSPHDKVILFATSATKHFANQIDILNHLVAYASHRPRVKIIVRCHPVDNASVYMPFQEHSDVIIWSTDSENALGPGNMTASSPLTSLAEMLYCCDVCVHVASTLRLDAAACNRPTISIAYDGNLRLPFRHAVRRLYAYSHQLPLNALRLDRMVYSKADLFEALDESLLQKRACNPDYRNRIREFTHFTEPVAVRTTMNVIREWLN